MKIYVLGTRGIPDVAGGVETHCERLYPRLASMGMDVTVVRGVAMFRLATSIGECVLSMYMLRG